MDIASGSTTIDRKRKHDDDTSASSLTAFTNIMNMSQLFNQFNDNSENAPEAFKEALQAMSKFFYFHIRGRVMRRKFSSFSFPKI